MTKLLSAAAALMILAATSAQAETKNLVMVSTTLAYQTQDIADARGAQRMLGRIALAARRLCASDSPVVRHVDAQARKCRAETVAHAVDALAAPLVTAAYRSGDTALASR